MPGTWRLEVGNGLLMMCRRNRMRRADMAEALAHLAVLPIEQDPETWSRAWDAVVEFADAHRLTVYDAAYLELASRRGLPLATLDRELRDAAAGLGVPLVV